MNTGASNHRIMTTYVNSASITYAGYVHGVVGHVGGRISSINANGGYVPYVLMTTWWSVSTVEKRNGYMM
jgi:hypothetical protein